MTHPMLMRIDRLRTMERTIGLVYHAVLETAVIGNHRRTVTRETCGRTSSIKML